jgi:hypothetical protein
MLYCAAEVTAPSACCMSTGRSRIASVSPFLRNRLFTNIFAFFLNLTSYGNLFFLFCLEFALLFIEFPQPINRDAIATKVIVFSWVLTFNLICVLLIHPLLWFQEPTNVVLSECLFYLQMLCMSHFRLLNVQRYLLVLAIVLWLSSNCYLPLFSCCDAISILTQNRIVYIVIFQKQL